MELSLFSPRRSLFSDPFFDWPERYWPRRYYEPFEDWMEPSYWPMVHNLDLGRILNDGTAVKNEKDRFSVQMDVSNFKPEELTVKTVNNDLVVHGKHEEKSDKHGFVKREFTRRYTMPSNCEMEKINTKLSDKGLLRIEAPKKVQAIEGQQERSIPIQMEVDKPAVEQKK